MAKTNVHTHIWLNVSLYTFVLLHHFCRKFWQAGGQEKEAIVNCGSTTGYQSNGQQWQFDAGQVDGQQ